MFSLDSAGQSVLEIDNTGNLTLKASLDREVGHISLLKGTKRDGKFWVQLSNIEMLFIWHWYVRLSFVSHSLQTNNNFVISRWSSKYIAFLNPFNSKSDQHLISPYLLIHKGIMRIKEMISNLRGFEEEML